MDRPPTQDGHDPVAEPLEAQAALHDLRVVRGQLDCARVAQEVRGVQQVDVQRVALDPLAAVEEAAQRRTSGSSRTPKRRSKAWTADIWYATGQMPQMRATMSITSSGVGPTTRRSK